MTDLEVIERALAAFHEAGRTDDQPSGLVVMDNGKSEMLTMERAVEEMRAGTELGKEILEIWRLGFEASDKAKAQRSSGSGN